MTPFLLPCLTPSIHELAPGGDQSGERGHRGNDDDRLEARQNAARHRTGQDHQLANDLVASVQGNPPDITADFADVWQGDLLSDVGVELCLRWVPGGSKYILRSYLEP